MWSISGSECVKRAVFCILEDYPWTDVDALSLTLFFTSITLATKKKKKSNLFYLAFIYSILSKKLNKLFTKKLHACIIKHSTFKTNSKPKPRWSRDHLDLETCYMLEKNKLYTKLICFEHPNMLNTLTWEIQELVCSLCISLYLHEYK